MKNIHRIVFGILMTLLSACQAVLTDERAALARLRGPEDVLLNKTALTLSPGGGEQLTASVFPRDAPCELVWSSSDPSVAEVSGGAVTARSAGVAVIFVTALPGRLSAYCVVTVSPP